MQFNHWMGKVVGVWSCHITQKVVEAVVEVDVGVVEVRI